MYYQCIFRQDISKENQTFKILSGWIEERGAKEGAMVELIGEEGLWKVWKVSTPGVEKLHEINNRSSIKGLKSIV